MVNNSITLKHFLNETAAIEALFSFGDPLAIGALYEIHKPFSTEGLQWFYGGGGYQLGMVSVSSTGGRILGGYFPDFATFGSNSYSSAGSNDIFICKP